MNIILHIVKKSIFMIICCSLFALSGTQPVQAYIEEVDDGGTKLTAGEINTNLNRLHDQEKISLKRLKQIDEMMAKSPNAGDGSVQNVLEVSQLVAEKEDENVRAAAELARETTKLLTSKQELRFKTSSAAIQAINEIASLNIRDEQAAAELLQEFLRNKP